MKELKMFMFPACPHCRRAKAMIAKLLEAHQEYKEVPFTEIDERKEKELAASYDYYYAPSFFVDDEKMAKGSAVVTVQPDRGGKYLSVFHTLNT